MGFNFASDQFSRFPTNCENPTTCEICKFVSDAVNEAGDAVCISKSIILDEEEITSSIFAIKTNHPEQSQAITMTDEFILAEQERDPDIQQTIWYLNNRRRPLDRDTSVNTVKHYLRYSKDKASKEGYLYVNNKGILVMVKNTPGIALKTSRPVIPEHLAMALIATIHLKRNHPKATQIQSILRSSFFIIKSSSKIEQVLNNCLLCNADEFLEKQTNVYSTSEPPDHPYQKLVADVMKRNGSIIMVVTDSLTSHTSSCLVKSEKAEDLELALVKTILPFRPGNGRSKVKVDTAPGLKKIMNNPGTLSRYDIALEPGRPKNKNSLGIVDKRIRELEDELRKILPEGDSVDENSLLLATKFLNERVRQHGFSANELLFRRKQETHEELNLEDKVLKEKVFEARKGNHPTKGDLSILPTIKVGQVGFIKHEKSKHSVRPAYFVTEVNYEKQLITAKKMLHIHSRIPTRFQNANYEIKMSDFILAKSSIIPMSFQTSHNASNTPLKSSRKTSTKVTGQNIEEEFSNTDTEDNDEENDEENDELESVQDAEGNNNPDNENDDSENNDSENGNNNMENPDDNQQGRQVLLQARPQRAAKNEAYRTRLWLRDQEPEDEVDNVDRDVLEQVDGNIITPDSLTPEVSPSKDLDRTDDIVAEYNRNRDVSSSSESSVFQCGSSSNIANLEWDNYASSPDLSGYSWTESSNYREITDPPILTQYFFNRKYPGRIPSRNRSRMKSFSENDVNKELSIEENDDQSCFSSRTIFRRFKQTLGLSSRSVPDLGVPNLQETSL